MQTGNHLIGKVWNKSSV